MEKSTQNLLRVEAIFHEAIAVPLDARAELVAALSNGDSELAAEVHSLLKASAAEETESASRSSLSADPKSAAEARRIGPYQVDSLLGRGGMGAVYLAHRADGHFEQKVAIKLIDLPLATDVFRERFRQERQILAGLQHPYIARLLDGGVTQNGDLYLAMEYVDGVPIHSFCNQQHLSVPERIELFIRVCEAVQFAHQNLVVHRDLKPDNIFVAEDGTPRLLDFGTAKLLAQSPANTGRDLTREGFQSFTPQYASPEQVLGNPITTASDTYSLGVLLYLLLTEKLPYELKVLTTAEMLRVICKEPPRKPDHLADSSSHIDSDLEAILLKALRKEPAERYRTAEQLAGDLRAYLDGRPVAARRGTIRYRAAKFVRRNRIAMAAASLIAVVLAAGIVGVLWQAKVANEERRRAEARSSDLRQLSSSLLSELDEAIKQLPGSTPVQKLLVTRVLEHLDRMASDAQGDRLTQLDLIDAYTRLGNIQGNGYDQNLGDPAGALVSLGKALAIAEPLAASAPNDLDALRALALAQQSRSEVLFTTARTQEAIPSMRAAVATYDRLIAAPNTSPALICEAAAANGTLGDELGQSGTASFADSAAALDAFRKTIALDNRALSIDPNFLRARRGLAIMLMKIGSIELDTDPAQALKDFQIALQRLDALPAAEQTTVFTTRIRSQILRKQADALEQLGEYSNAVSLFTQSIQIQSKLAAADPQDLRAQADLGIVLDDEAMAYKDAANSDLAAPRPALSIDRRRNLSAEENLLTQVVAMTQSMLKRSPSDDEWKSVLADAQVKLGTAQSLLHGPGDSAAIAKTGIATLRELATKDQAAPRILNQAADAFLTVEPASLRDPAFAVACAEHSIALSHRQSPAELLVLAQAYRATGQIEKSRAAAQEGLALLSPLEPGSVKPNIRKLLEIQARPAGK
jgi:eukaryotic-like serine/threonine-protein kinase